MDCIIAVHFFVKKIFFKFSEGFLFSVPLYIIEDIKKAVFKVLHNGKDGRGGIVLKEEMPEKDKIFMDMLEKYEKLAFSICYKMTSNYFDAEDMAQETFLAVYKSLDSFDGDNPGGFITKIAVNKCLDYLRRADRRAVPSEDSVLLQNMSCVPPPEDSILQEETMRGLASACQSLKPPYNEIAAKYYCNSMTAAQIAGSSGKKLKTVQTQIRRAKEMLKRKLRKEDWI